MYLDPKTSGVTRSIEGHKPTVSSRNCHRIIVLKCNWSDSRFKLPNEKVIESLHAENLLG